MLLHGSIISIFALAKVYKMGYHKPHSHKKNYQHTNIINGSQKFFLFHLKLILWVIFTYVSFYLLAA